MGNKISKSAPIKGSGTALNTLAKGSVDGAAAFFGRICLPAAEEFGLLLKDKVHAYRQNNMVAIAQSAEAILDQYGNHAVTAHPRLVSEILEHGSWTDDETIQKMWAGLLISSCDETGQDDGNLIFIDLLRQLSTAQVKILDYACQHSNKIIIDADVLSCNTFNANHDTITEISQVKDKHRIHRELAHLRALGLIVDGEVREGWHQPDKSSSPNAKPVYYIDVSLTPSDLAFHLYVRSKGFNGSPIEFFFGADYFKNE